MTALLWAPRGELAKRKFFRPMTKGLMLCFARLLLSLVQWNGVQRLIELPPRVGPAAHNADVPGQLVAAPAAVRVEIPGEVL